MNINDETNGFAPSQNHLDIHWAAIFNAITDPAMILDRHYVILAANSACIGMTGLPQDEIVGKQCVEVFHCANYRVSTGCPMEKMLQSGVMRQVAMEMEALGGSLLVTCTPVLDANGNLDKIIHIATDRISHDKNELALLEQRSFTNSVVRNSTVAMFALDFNHNVQIWNKACEYLTGFSRADMIGTKDHWKAFHEKKQPTMADAVLDGDFSRLPKLYTHVSRSTHNPKGYRTEGWFVQVNGKDRYLFIEAAPIYDRYGNITHVLETINDLTESKSLEEQLMHAQKMESIGHLAGGIAHEFNNILAVILGYGQIMRKEFAPDSTNRHDMDQILTAAERAAVLTKGLLAFSRKQHVSLTNLNVNVLVHDTLKSFSRIMGDDIIIKESMDDVPLIVYGDHSLLTQVLMNLMSNARDAMPNGGELDISAKRTVLYELYLTPFCSVPPGKYAQISLTDNGNGMDEETIKQIFEPFFTTKDVGKGTGLGLSVVYGIVSQHNGYICVSSTPGKSTTFDLYFPLIAQHASNMSALLLPDSLPGGDETILLADDDPVLLMLFSDILSEMGYHVITATDGLDAIEKFTENQEEIKLLILDAQMPKKCGLEVYKEIKLIKPECKVLFVSGYNEEHFQEEITIEEDSELLAKPFAPDDLATRVRKILDVVKKVSDDNRRPS